MPPPPPRMIRKQQQQQPRNKHGNADGPASSPLASLSNPYQKVAVLFFFSLGALLGYISWIVGVLFLFQALRSAIRLVRYQRSWLSAIHNVGRNCDTRKGRIVQATRHVDKITKDISYQAIYEYDDDNDDEIHHDNHLDASWENVVMPVQQTTKTKKKTVTSFLEAQWLYNYQNYHAIVRQAGDAILEVKVLDHYPESGIPSDLLYHKLSDCKLWAKYIDPTIAFVGIHIYVLGCVTYAWIVTLNNDNTTEFYTLLVLSLGVAPIAMMPYLLLEQEFYYQQRMHYLQTDPILLHSELEYIKQLWQNRLGTTRSKKVHAILFGIGLLEMLYTTKLATLPGMVAVWAWTLLYSEVPSPKEHLSRYENHDKAKTVHGEIVDKGHVLIGAGSFQYQVTIRYTTTLPDDGSVVTVEKQVLVPKDVYQECITSATVPIRVLKDYPCSGYPIDKLVKEITGSLTMTGVQMVCFFAGILYLLASWLAMIDVDFYWDSDDVFGFGIYTVIGPLLMMPQASTLHRIRYKKLFQETMENGKIIAKENTPADKMDASAVC